MISLIKRLNNLIRVPRSEETSYTAFWWGAFYGLAVLSLMVMLFSGVFYRTGLPTWVMAGATLLIGIISFWFFRIIGTLIHKWISKVPAFLFALFFGTIGTLILARYIRFGFPQHIYYLGFTVIIIGITFLFGSAMVLYRRASNRKALHIISVISSLALFLIGGYYLFYKGYDPYQITFEQTPTALLSEKGITNPGEKGSYSTQFFTYGSGSDKQREEFRTGNKYKSKTVDASRLLPEWKGSKAKWRERYWGFGVKKFPLNGRVWMPQGDGKFPIILIVHGNHGMEEHSDPGYAYLGELLSSRGFITVSVDENFINGTWSGDFMGKEMPTRGWLLLKHLEQWKEWANDPEHELYQKADLENVILAGHSRGGEAAPIAAHFNTLSHFPDDANEKFDFNFGIKGVLSIAPTDKRYDRRINLENVNYLSIQGSYDSDEASFFGYRQYQRITFTDTTFYFKSGLYVHGANHGQFNSVWGQYDGGAPGKYLLNIAPMMSMEEQQQIAKVYISAFAEAVLHNNNSYNGLFKNAASAKDWLPEQILVNAYKDSNIKSLITYEEDIDVTTGTTEGATTMAKNLKVWREEILRFRDKDTQGNNAVILGWEKDSTAKAASYRITFKSTIPVDSSSSLLFSMAQGDAGELKTGDAKKEKEPNESNELDFQIQLMDSLGNDAVVDISNVKKLTPRLKVQYVKLKGLNQENYGATWEPTMETFELPLSVFNNTKVRLDHLKSITINFNKTEKGVLILDEIGLKLQ
ncbi:MAG: hypothetical protein RIF39_07835 [Cyclobacteriaceae bacterium]